MEADSVVGKREGLFSEFRPIVSCKKNCREFAKIRTYHDHQAVVVRSLAVPVGLGSYT